MVKEKSEKLDYSIEKVKKIKEIKEIKEGLKVYSNKNIADEHVKFSIAVGEIKNLPIDYEKSELIKSCLKTGELVIMKNQETDIKKDVSLDEKDIANFLNNNTTTVIKQLRINTLSKEDLKKLLIGERANKSRQKIIDFIKSLEKVI